MNLFEISSQIFAHGTEVEHQNEWALNTYFLIGAALLLALFLILFFITKNKVNQLENVKKKEDREKRFQLAKSANLLKWISIVSLIAVVISGAIALSSSGGNGSNRVSEDDMETTTTLTHVHGLAYSADGHQIMIPAHDGIKVYSGGKWSNGEGETHDYMGFSIVDNGFYSSGHPALGSNKKNPFGIVKSTNEDPELEMLSLYGEVDFHQMNVGYKNHTIYVNNPRSNSEMKSEGIYYSEDGAQTWSQSEMKGFSGDVTLLAVHPTNSAIVALGSRNALYLSFDYGNQFEKVLPAAQTTALYFNPQGELWIGAYNQEAMLLRMDIDTQEILEIKIPSLVEDAVSYVAQSPVNDQELAIATFNKDVYLSNDQGLNWTKIADQGTGISQ